MSEERKEYFTASTAAAMRMDEEERQTKNLAFERDEITRLRTELATSDANMRTLRTELAAVREALVKAKKFIYMNGQAPEDQELLNCIENALALQSHRMPQAARSEQAGTVREAPRSSAGLAGNNQCDNNPASELPGQVDASQPAALQSHRRTEETT